MADRSLRTSGMLASGSAMRHLVGGGYDGQQHSGPISPRSESTFPLLAAYHARIRGRTSSRCAAYHARARASNFSWFAARHARP